MCENPWAGRPVELSRGDELLWDLDNAVAEPVPVVGGWFDAASSKVRVLAYNNLPSQGVDPNTSGGPAVTNKKVFNGKAKVAPGVDGGPDRLLIEFDATWDFHITAKGDGLAYRAPMTKHAQFWLNPAPKGSEHTWLIDGYRVEVKAGESVLNTTR